MEKAFGWVAATAAVEVFADFQLRFFAQTDKSEYLWKGLVGYVGVIYLLIRSLRHANVLYVNGLWDGLSSLIESVAAYTILGDRLHNGQQYVGLLLTVAGVVLLRMGA